MAFRLRNATLFSGVIEKRQINVNNGCSQRRSEGGAGRTGRHLLGAANGRNFFFKIHVKIQIVISYVFACNKNKALQLQRVPILSILGYDIGSLAASASTLLVIRQFCVGADLYRILVRSFPYSFV